MKIEKTDAERLKLAFEGKSKSQFVRETSFSGGASMVSQHLSGNRPISLKAAKIYADWLGIAVREISPSAADALDELTFQTVNYGTPTGDSYTHFQRVAVADSDNPNLIEIRKVLLRLSAGITGFSIDTEVDDGQPIVFRKSWFDKHNYNPSKLLAIKVKGDSMEPALYHDDTVVINTADTTLKDGDVYAVNYEGEPVVKRLIRDIGQWWLFSDNPDQRKYHRKICQGDGCIVIGKVVHRQTDRI